MKYTQTGSYNSFKDITENIILFHLIDLLGNVNHVISVVGYWIFESNYKKELVLNISLLDIICAPSVGEEQAVKFVTVFTAVRYIRFSEQLKKGQL